MTEISRESKLQADIDKLKDTAPYKEKFATEESQQLNQAIDILGKLQTATFLDASNVGFDKIRHAKAYLDKLLKAHLEEDKDKSE